MQIAKGQAFFSIDTCSTHTHKHLGRAQKEEGAIQSPDNTSLHTDESWQFYLLFSLGIVFSVCCKLPLIFGTCSKANLKSHQPVVLPKFCMPTTLCLQLTSEVSYVKYDICILKNYQMHKRPWFLISIFLMLNKLVGGRLMQHRAQTRVFAWDEAGNPF